MIRRKPYTPIFDITPVSSMATGVGAAAYAGACQMCSGASGTFTHSPARTAQKISGLTSSAFFGELDEVERAGFPVQKQEAQQHRHAAQHGEQEKVQRCAVSLLAFAEEFDEEKGGTSASSQ